MTLVHWSSYIEIGTIVMSAAFDKKREGKKRVKCQALYVSATITFETN